MNNTFAHVYSVRDIDYPVVPDNSFHSSFYDSSWKRILHELPQELIPVAQQVIMLESTTNVWAVVFESKHQPVYTIRNLAHSNVSPNFRRVLRVNIDVMSDISSLIHNNQTIVV